MATLTFETKRFASISNLPLNLNVKKYVKQINQFLDSTVI